MYQNKTNYSYACLTILLSATSIFGKNTDFYKSEKHELKELPHHPSGEKLTFRFAPSPSGPLHIGHAYVISLNSLYAVPSLKKFEISAWK